MDSNDGFQVKLNFTQFINIFVKLHHFSAKTTCGYVFSEVNLSDDWAEYDEENDLSVSIVNLEHKIERG